MVLGEISSHKYTPPKQLGSNPIGTSQAVRQKYTDPINYWEFNPTFNYKHDFKLLDTVVFINSRNGDPVIDFGRVIGGYYNKFRLYFYIIQRLQPEEGIFHVPMWLTFGHHVVASDRFRNHFTNQDRINVGTWLKLAPIRYWADKCIRVLCPEYATKFRKGQLPNVQVSELGIPGGVAVGFHIDVNTRANVEQPQDAPRLPPPQAVVIQEIEEQRQSGSGSTTERNEVVLKDYEETPPENSTLNMRKYIWISTFDELQEEIRKQSTQQSSASVVQYMGASGSHRLHGSENQPGTSRELARQLEQRRQERTSEGEDMQGNLSHPQSPQSSSPPVDSTIPNPLNTERIQQQDDGYDPRKPVKVQNYVKKNHNNILFQRQFEHAVEHVSLFSIRRKPRNIRIGYEQLYRLITSCK